MTISFVLLQDGEWIFRKVLVSLRQAQGHKLLVKLFFWCISSTCALGASMLVISSRISAFAGSLMLNQGYVCLNHQHWRCIPHLGDVLPNSKKALQRLCQLDSLSASINVTLKPPQLLLFPPTFKSPSCYLSPWETDDPLWCSRWWQILPDATWLLSYLSVARKLHVL